MKMNNRHLPLHSPAAMRAARQERERIGYELHDNINPILASAQLYLSALQSGCPDFESMKARTAEIISLAIEEVRCLAHNIISPRPIEKGLIESIAGMVDDVRQSRRFLITFHHTDARMVDSRTRDLKFALLRIVQEQLRNICKHSQAATIAISLHCTDDQLRLQVSDDGIGFDEEQVSPGLGLSHIFERATHLGGKALIRTAPGKGCTLIITIPLHPDQIC